MPLENKKLLSIVIPVFNEEPFLHKLYEDLLIYFNNISVEVIFINDGSEDKSKKILENLKQKNKHEFDFIIINLDKNTGKGNAVKSGLDLANGEYLLLQDADLELDVKDCREMYEIIKNDQDIKCIFGSRYLSGKLKKHNYFFNEMFGKINTLIFNLLFGQSLTDVHCGLKIFHSEVYKNIQLTVKDFGLEIDIAAQVIKQNYFIYEVGVSYFSRSKIEGKKITWIDGLKSYYYLFKVRFIDNVISVKLSIIVSCLYMTYVGSYFGMGIGKYLFVITFFFFGLIVGLHTRILSTLMLFGFIYVGSFFGKGQGKVLFVLMFFLLGIYLIKKIRKLPIRIIKKKYLF